MAATDYPVMVDDSQFLVAKTFATAISNPASICALCAPVRLLEIVEFEPALVPDDSRLAVTWVIDGDDPIRPRAGRAHALRRFRSSGGDVGLQVSHDAPAPTGVRRRTPRTSEEVLR